MAGSSNPRDSNQGVPMIVLTEENMYLVMAQLQEMAPLMHQMRQTLGALLNPSPLQPMRLFQDGTSPSLTPTAHPVSHPIAYTQMPAIPQTVLPQGEMLLSTSTSPRAPTPLAEHLAVHNCPPKFRPPHLSSFNGSRNLDDHIGAFIDELDLYDLPEGIRCRLLASTLSGPARSWFHNLPRGSISSLSDLCGKLSLQFAYSLPLPVTRSSITTIRQQPDESVRSYLQRFSECARLIPGGSDDLLVASFIGGLLPGNLGVELSRPEPRSTNELLHRVSEYIAATELDAEKLLISQPVVATEAAKASAGGSKHQSGKGKAAKVLSVDVRGKGKGEPKIGKAGAKKPDKGKRLADMYCEYHKCKTHNTADCRAVKRAAEEENSQRRGVAQPQGHVGVVEAQSDPRVDRSLEISDSIYTIHAISRNGGRLSRGTKRSAEVFSVGKIHYPFALTAEYLELRNHARIPLVIRAYYGTKEVHRVLVDEGPM